MNPGNKEILKACPFCKGRAHIKKSKSFDFDDVIAVGCQTRDCIMYLSPGGSGTKEIDRFNFDTYEHAVKAWKTRPSEKQELDEDKLYDWFVKQEWAIYKSDWRFLAQAICQIFRLPSRELNLKELKEYLIPIINRSLTDREIDVLCRAIADFLEGKNAG